MPTHSSRFDRAAYRDHFRVAIFGSARIRPGDPAYRRIVRLAKLIAAAGIDVVTGGGPGLMEAACQGHRAGRNGNRTLAFGLTIKLPREEAANRHLDIKREFDRFSTRLDTFMDLSNVVVVAPGGVGTLLELFYSWQLVQVRHRDRMPIILLGRMWEELVDWLREWPVREGLISPGDLDLLQIARDYRAAMRLIDAEYRRFLGR